MAERSDKPMATLGELATHHRTLIGQQPVIIENRIRRLTLKQKIAGYVQRRAARLGRMLSRRAEEKPLAAIAIGLGAGLIAGELLRRAVAPPRRWR